jgi:hypothetical protein
MIDDEDSLDRMSRFLGVLIRKKRVQDRTTTAICREARPYRTLFGELAMFALAKEWIRVEEVDSAKVYSVTRLGREAYKRLMSTASNRY